MEQVNLNRPDLWEQPVPFNARAMALALGLVVAVLAVVYGYQGYRLGQERAALERVEAEREQVRARLEEVKSSHQRRLQVLEGLRGDVSGLESRLAELRRAEATLSRRLRAAGRKGELVRGLGRARAEQDGVWLTRFRLTGVTPVTLRLEGRALDPELIPRYLQAVSDQAVYRGGFFRDLKASSPKQDGGAPPGFLTFESEAAFPLIGEEGS